MIAKKRAAGMLAAFVAGAAVSAFVCAFVTVKQLPDALTVNEAGSTRLATFLPVSVEYNGESGSSAQAKLFGMVGVKRVAIRREEPKKVLLAGTPFGLKLLSDGVMVVGLSDFKSDGAKVNPAHEAGISEGDVIHKAGGKAVYTNSAFAEIVKSSRKGILVELTDRDGRQKKTVLTPRFSDADGCLKTGMWVRDSAAGIGTLTYIDPESGTFGGLGHGICDADTHDLISIHEGGIVEAQITDVRLGVKGIAGELRGFLGRDELGVLTDNTVCGAFGRYTAEIPDWKEYETAFKQSVKTGKAKILCTVEPDGKPRFYDITIDKINYSGVPAKNMIITVTDEKLLKLTGGIIQGMSGSPIVQKGKFVGAVTHVFVNNPKSGYAIFAENMLDQA